MSWPDHVEEMGADYRSVMETGLARAEAYGLDTEQTVARYLNLWFIWGVAFEDGARFAWAREILGDAGRGAELKIHQLNWRTQKELAAAEREPHVL